MGIDKWTSLASRVFFAIALVTLGLGIIEKIANLAGYTITKTYTPERLLEITVAFAVLILVLLLRQIREELRQKAG